VGYAYSVRLRLEEIKISNYKSIRKAVIDRPESLAFFVGRNDAGKSNVLTLLKFLAEAGQDLTRALNVRGGFSELVWRKRVEESIAVEMIYSTPSEIRNGIIGTFLGESSESVRHWVLSTPFLTRIHYFCAFSPNAISEFLAITGTRSLDAEHILSLSHGAGGAASLEERHPNFPRTENGHPGWPESVLARPSARPNQLCLGSFQGMVNAIPPWKIIMELVRQDLMSIEYVSPVHNSQPIRNIQSETELDAESQNLADVMHGLNNNRNDRFVSVVKELQNLIPGLPSLLTPTIGGQTTLAVREPSERDTHYTMPNMSFGTRRLTGIVAGLLSPSSDKWYCIEEPEAHLHPRAQQCLLEFLQRASEDRRIFVATHSPVFANLSSVENLFLVKRDHERNTIVTKCSPETVVELVGELGLLPSHNLNADILIFVEGPTDASVWQALLRKFDMERRIEVIPTEGWTNIMYYAEAQIYQRMRSKPHILAIFDGDVESNQANRDKFAEVKVKLNPEERRVLDQHDIEGYFLDARVLRKSFPAEIAGPKLAILDDSLRKHGKRIDQKEALVEVLRSVEVGPYTPEMAGRIASHLELNETLSEVVSLLKSWLATT